MVTAATLVDDLRAEVERGAAFFILGSGISLLATDNAPTASWRGLLRNGVDRVVELRRCKPATAKRLIAQIDSDDLDEMLNVATFVARKLGQPHDGEFRRWLREAIGSLEPKEPAILEALNRTGCALLTTNYDTLLEQATDRLPITWQDVDRCELVLRGTEQAIIHFHGFWRSPETIILGQDTYAVIGNNERIQTLIRAAHLEKTFVYVGCGDGLSDPNFAKFLAWSESLFPDSQSRRYRLGRDQDVATLQQIHPPKQRVQPLSGRCTILGFSAFSAWTRPRSSPKADLPHRCN